MMLTARGLWWSGAADADDARWLAAFGATWGS